jgi:hypothetical protein
MSKRHRKLEVTLTTTLEKTGLVLEDRFRIYPCRHVHYNFRVLDNDGATVVLDWNTKDKRIRKSNEHDAHAFHLLESIFGTPAKGATRACRRGNDAATA